MIEPNPAYDYWDEYAFWEDIEYVTPTIEHDIRPKGNQGKNQKTKSACTIVWAVNQLIRLFWLDMDMTKTNELYLEVVDYCVWEWYVIWNWWSTPVAVNAVCKWWNNIGYKRYNKEQVFWLRLLWDSSLVKEALDKGHLVGYTKNVNFSSDQVEWLVRHEPSMYPKMVWHRLNWKGIKYTKATGWADLSTAERGSQDNYHWAIWENFWFKTVKPYINNWIYAYWYVIMPVSCMKSNIEEEKKKIALLKAVNAVIAILTSTRWDLPEAYQELSASYAAALRDQYPEARPLMKDQKEKVYQSLVDFLSYAWKYADEEEQILYAELAKHLREKFNLN